MKYYTLGLFNENDYLIDMEISLLNQPLGRVLEDGLLLDHVARAHEIFQNSFPDKIFETLRDCYNNMTYKNSLATTLEGHYIRPIHHCVYDFGLIDVHDTTDITGQVEKFNLIDNHVATDIIRCVKLYKDYKKEVRKNAV